MGLEWDSGSGKPRLTPDGTVRDWLLTPPASFIALCAVGFPHADRTGPL